jgi:hypothetical protein
MAEVAAEQAQPVEMDLQVVQAVQVATELHQLFLVQA